MTEHTGPEMNTERRICGRVRAKILRNPCAHCLHRVEAFDLVGCSIGTRRFPMCMGDGRTPFDIDWSTIKRAA